MGIPPATFNPQTQGCQHSRNFRGYLGHSRMPVRERKPGKKPGKAEDGQGLNMSGVDKKMRKFGAPLTQAAGVISFAYRCHWSWLRTETRWAEYSSTSPSSTWFSSAASSSSPSLPTSLGGGQSGPKPETLSSPQPLSPSACLLASSSGP